MKPCQNICYPSILEYNMHYFFIRYTKNDPKKQKVYQKFTCYKQYNGKTKHATSEKKKKKTKQKHILL